MVSEPCDAGAAADPVADEMGRRFQLQPARAGAPELVRHVPGPGQQLLVDLAPPVEAVRVGRRARHAVVEPVGGQPRPLSAVDVLVGLELGPEEGNAAGLRPASARFDEAVGFGMLGRGVVEDDDVLAVAVKQSALAQLEQQHGARASAGELDDVRQALVPPLPVADHVSSASRHLCADLWSGRALDGAGVPHWLLFQRLSTGCLGRWWLRRGWCGAVAAASPGSSDQWSLHIFRCVFRQERANQQGPASVVRCHPGVVQVGAGVAAVAA